MHQSIAIIWPTLGEVLASQVKSFRFCEHLKYCLFLPCCAIKSWKILYPEICTCTKLLIIHYKMYPRSQKSLPDHLLAWGIHFWWLELLILMGNGWIFRFNLGNFLCKDFFSSPTCATINLELTMRLCTKSPVITTGKNRYKNVALKLLLAAPYFCIFSLKAGLHFTHSVI